uniref:Uncharacterized protein n=1 Tax=Bactrocera dorsalis TaxID=27457 RepID=A0A034VZT7_BACDO
MSLSKNNCGSSTSLFSEDSDNSIVDVTYFPVSANDSSDSVYGNDEDNPPHPTTVNSIIYDNCFEEDSPDLELCTPVPEQNSFDLQPSTSTSNINNSSTILVSPAMKKKRKQPENWKKNMYCKKKEK